MKMQFGNGRWVGLATAAAIGVSASAWAQAPTSDRASGTPVPDWKINEICAVDSAVGQCTAFEVKAQNAIRSSWPFVFDDVRKACIASIKPAERSWRVLSDCVDETMEKQRDAQAVKTRATPGEPVPPSRLVAEARAKAEADALAKQRADAEAQRLAAEEEARKRAEQDAATAAALRRAAEDEAQRKAQSDSALRAKAEADAKAKAELEARARADSESKARAEAETRAKAEADARSAAEARARADAEAKARAEADTKARAEADARAKALADARVKADAEAREKAEVDAKLRADVEAKAAAEARTRAEADAKARAEAEARAKACQEPITLAAKSGPIRFRIESATLQPDSLKVLNAVAAAFKKCTNVAVTVEGHTDTAGDDAINVPLSNARAEAVKDYLVKAGVPPDRIKSAGFGSSRPAATNETPEGRAQNRRIDFVVSAP